MESKRNTNGNIIRILLGTVLVLLIPLLLGWPWTLSDFIIMGTLLFGTGMTYELIARKMGTAKQRVILGLIILAAFLLIWAELAVGVFGSPFAGS